MEMVKEKAFSTSQTFSPIVFNSTQVGQSLVSAIKRQKAKIIVFHAKKEHDYEP